MDIKLMPEKYKKKGIGSGSNQSNSGLLKSLGRLVLETSLWFVLSFILLIIVTLTCFGLWGYKINLNKDKDNVVQRIEELQSQRNLDLENNFIELKETIENFKGILNKRLYFSNVLKMLEETTLPNVQYDSLNVNLNNLSIGLRVETVSYRSLAEQILIFKNDSRINKIGFSEISLEKSGLVGTDLSLELNSSFLYE